MSFKNTIKMSQNLDQFVEAIEFLSDIVGRTSTIKIDSGIFEHSSYDDDTLNIEKDIMKIRGSVNNPISISDILKVFKQMQKQFEEVPESRSYFYEGIHKTGKNNYQIYWGS